MNKKQLKGDCVSNPFGSLGRLCMVIDSAREITKRTFLRCCDTDDELLVAFNQFPNDYVFYKYKKVYFYTWSAIEFFYF